MRPNSESVSGTPWTPAVVPGNRPTELNRDPLLTKLFFCHVEEWILRESERWERPWRFLANVRGLAPICYDFFNVAATVSNAALKLGHIQYGGGTLHRSLIDDILKQSATGNDREADRLAIKLLRHQFASGVMWQDLTKHCKNQCERAMVEKVLKQEEAKLVKRYGRNWRKKLTCPTQEQSEQQYKEEFLMVWSWLRWGVGEPGLCFYNDEAIADLLVILLKRETSVGLGTQTEYYRKMRQRLGLIQLNYRQPRVRKVRRVPGTGLIEIEFREGTDWNHRNLSEACVLGGRQFYPIPS